MADDLVVHLARFAGALREHGVNVGIGDEVDATNALTLIDVFDRAEVRRAFRIALKIRPGDGAAFDAIFDACWNVRRAARRLPAGAFAKAGFGASLAPRGRAAGGVHVAAGRHHNDRRPSDRSHPGYTPDEVLRRKPFEECSERDLVEMERLLARLKPRWAARRSRRLKPVRGRGLPDLRRSFRRAVATGGEMVRLAHRARTRDEPQVVVLCDTSGSMDVHVKFLLAFVLALKDVAKKTEVFAFNTSLTRLTPWLSPGKIARTIERLTVDLPDWSGGTRIGESLMEFAVSHLPQAVSSRSVVVILSDGLDRGDTSLVASAMRAIRAKARRIIWLNPLAGDPRYQPTARAMEAALPFIDRLAPAHNLESLERLLPELATV
jgi:uncharacterized protein with von Willebrand factor type A (vWA) domain